MHWSAEISYFEFRYCGPCRDVMKAANNRVKEVKVLFLNFCFRIFLSYFFFSFTLYFAHSRVGRGEPSVKTLFPIFRKILEALRVVTQRHALPLHQGEEMKIWIISLREINLLKKSRLKIIVKLDNSLRTFFIVP